MKRPMLEVLSSTQFGSFDVLHEVQSRNGMRYARVKCRTCSFEKDIQFYDLMNRKARCPHCYSQSMLLKRMERQAAKPKVKTGESKKYPSEYQCWQNIKKRCFNVRHPQYADYGARGITMHPAWVSNFKAFLGHVGPKPHPGVSLDRIDNDKGYCPGNLRWATPRVQNNNKRTGFRPVDEVPVSEYLSAKEVPWCF